nr:reactive Intermediate Deaminase A, chloroplastic-like isoform X5 [Ipomoea trifida]GMC72444.1 Reactive Intermediate Deaminase A, chloroplastic [Ipomoea batatas]GMC74532.1 Reactive Intermediate Deaminase A, chloroplastic [Ipomoea batatas]
MAIFGTIKWTVEEEAKHKQQSAVQVEQQLRDLVSESEKSMASLSVSIGTGGKEAVYTDKVPDTPWSSSQAIKANNLLFVSGVLGLDPVTAEILSENVDDETDQALKNMGEILKAGGADYSSVVKTTIFLADLTDLSRVDAVYAKYFSSPEPACAIYQVAALPKGATIAVECIAAL